MVIVEYLLCVLLFVVCGMSAYTDFRYGKIKNVIVIPSTILSLLINVIYQLHMGAVGMYLLNFFMVVVLSMILYFIRFWSAGDSKLLIFIISAMPVKLYTGLLKGYFSSFAVIMVIFLTAFLYFFVESLVLYMKKADFLHFKSVPFQKKVSLFLTAYLCGFSCITISNTIFFMFFRDFYIQNRYLFMMLNFFIVVYLSSRKIFLHLKYTLALFLIALSGVVFTDYRQMLLHTDYKFLILVLFVLVVKNFINRYNYRKVNVLDLKEGMIVSCYSLEQIMSEKNKLLQMYDESMASKLSSQDILHIQALAKEKKIDSLYVLRNIPFGVLISFSSVLFVIVGGIYVHTQL